MDLKKKQDLFLEQEQKYLDHEKWINWEKDKLYKTLQSKKQENDNRINTANYLSE